MKKIGIILIGLVLFISTLLAVPVKNCEREGDLIADTEYEENYYLCNKALMPELRRCAIGLIFDITLRICINAYNPDHEKVCKPEGCLRGSVITFRKRCPDGRC